MCLNWHGRVLLYVAGGPGWVRHLAVKPTCSYVRKALVNDGIQRVSIPASLAFIFYIRTA